MAHLLRVALSCLATLPALCLLAACNGKLAHRHEDVVQAHAVVAADVKRLEIEVAFGSITVLADAGNPDTVTFAGSTLRAADTASELTELRAVDLNLHASTVERVLRLAAPPLPAGVSPERARMVVRGIVRCPVRLEVAVRTAIGSIKVQAATGVDVRTGYGEVALVACRGRGTVHTERGDIVIDKHRGSLALTAPSGSARAFLAELDRDGVRAKAQGDVQIHVPRTSAFTLQARTERGRCHNSFGVPVVIEGSAASMAGPVREGGPPIELHAAAGAITVGVTD
jgi:hypothetical protein